MTLYCTRNLKGNFKVGMRTEKSRLRRSLMSLQDEMWRMRHLSVRKQVNNLNIVPRGHYAYYGFAGNFRSLQKVHRAMERYWHKLLCSRSWAGRITWIVPPDQAPLPIFRPKLYISPTGIASSRSAVNHLLKSVVRENRTLRSVGTGGGHRPR